MSGVVGLNHSLFPSLLVYGIKQCVGVMHYEIGLHLTFHHAAKLEWLYSRFYRLYRHLAMLQRLLPTTELHHVREPAASEVFSEGTFWYEYHAVYRHVRIDLQHTEDLVAKLNVTRLLHINASNFSCSFFSSCVERQIQACHHRMRQQPSFASPKLPAPASS